MVLMRTCLCSVLWIAASAFAAQGPADVVTPDAQKIKVLIEKLNAADTIQREDAERELLALGTSALPQLREATKAAEPEIAARATRLVSKMVEVVVKTNSYADVFPANAVFFFEIPDVRKTLDHIRLSPLGKFWDSPAMQAFYKGHKAAQVDNDIKVLDSVQAIPKVIDGKAFFGIGDPETIEANEIDPPMIYALETKQPQILESQIRSLFQGMADPIRSTRKFGVYTVEEQNSAQTVFSQDGVIHALTTKGLEEFLKILEKHPAKTLTPALADLRAFRPAADVIWYVGVAGLKKLAEAGQLVDDEHVEMFDALGIIAGSVWQSAATITPDGVEEISRLTIGGGDANKGLFAVFTKMAGAVPEPAAANTPQSLDVIPYQAALLISFQGDVAKNAAEIGKALRSFDAATAPVNTPVKNVPPPPNNTKPLKPPAPPPDANRPPVPKSPAEAALAAGNDLKDPKKEDDVKPAPAAITYPHIEHLEKMGMKLEGILEQADGPIQLALFTESVSKDIPQSIPLSPLVAMCLKDPKVIEQALELAAAGPKPRFTKELLNGGTHYIDTEGDAEDRPGFWLRGNYFVYSNLRDLVELAGAAALHQAGNERMADRASYKKALAARVADPKSLISVFGDADQVLEMPYTLSVVNWQEDDKNPWPNYQVIRKLLTGKSISVQFKSMPGGLQIESQTPFSLMGLIEAFRRPLKEAGFLF